MVLREKRRINRNLHKIAADLGASSRSMKRKGTSSKTKTSAPVSIPDSLPHIPRVHGTGLTFRFPKFSTRFQNFMVNKNIIYGKPVDPVLFHKIGVTTLFENVGLSLCYLHQNLHIMSYSSNSLGICRLIQIG